MKTKIKSITIISQCDIMEYIVGYEYNGILLDRIEDRSKEYENATEFIYCGLTENDSIVFELINAPIDVQYEIDKE